MIGALAISAALEPAGGQSPAAPGPGAKLAGVAVDSIRGGYLRGASIFISGTTLSAVTDSLGRFAFRNIPAGSRTMEVQHALLDSLGLALTTPTKTFVDGDSSFVMLSLPSARTYIATTCPAESRATGDAMIIGTVGNAVTRAPIPDAAVTISWVEYEVAKNTIKTLPQLRTAKAGNTGEFRICGLPDDLTATVVASSGRDSTAEIEVDLRGLVVISPLYIPPDAASTTLSGRVFDNQGRPAGGARVFVEVDASPATTDSEGRFSLPDVRPGTRMVMVRKIGYEPVQRAVDIPPDGLSGQNFTLGSSVAVLRNVVVRATQDLGLQRVGFAERKLKRPGSFVTPRDIELRNGPGITDLLRTYPIMRRPGCTRYFVDGFLQPQYDNPNDYISGAEIGAVEIYGTGFVPPEFFATTTTGQRCKAVVIWTKWKIGKR